MCRQHLKNKCHKIPKEISFTILEIIYRSITWTVDIRFTHEKKSDYIHKEKYKMMAASTAIKVCSTGV